jgi:hypothetical protein
MSQDSYDAVIKFGHGHKIYVNRYGSLTSAELYCPSCDHIVPTYWTYTRNKKDEILKCCLDSILLSVFYHDVESQIR